MDTLSPHANDSNPILKRCTICGNEFPATSEFFHRDKNRLDGLVSLCKKCACQKSLAHHYAHQEQANAKRRQNHADHREERNAKNRVYVAEHREEVAIRSVAWRHANRERWRARKREEYHTRRSRKMAVSGTYTSAQIQDLLKRQKHRCYYCATKFKRVKQDGQWKYLYEVDHTFPISRVAGTDIPANDISYLVLACSACNNSKKNKFPWEWPEGGRLL